MENEEKTLIVEEKVAKARSGMGIMLLIILGNLLVLAAGIALIATNFDSSGATALGIIGVVLIALVFFGWIPLCGLKVLRPNEAYVLTLFGKYTGTLKGPGFFWVNPFSTAINPAREAKQSALQDLALSGDSQTSEKAAAASLTGGSKRISLKTMTLNNEKQKINDKLGNPIIIGIVVTWKVANTAKAVFNVENYVDFLSMQCDSALRNIVRLYPYDDPFDDADDPEPGEKSLRGSSVEIAQNLKDAIQAKVEVAGLEIIEARITHLSYAPEIAAAMLQRQQASAIISARQMIVEGAVGMVEMALAKLSENGIVELDEERKAAMVSNLLVVLCGNRDAQPVVNSGSLY